MLNLDAKGRFGMNPVILKIIHNFLVKKSNCFIKPANLLEKLLQTLVIYIRLNKNLEHQIFICLKFLHFL